MTGIYQVVEFDEDKNGSRSIGIICTSWTFLNKGVLYAFYPPIKEYYKSVKYNAEVNKISWTPYPVRQLKTNIGK